MTGTSSNQIRSWVTRLSSTTSSTAGVIALAKQSDIAHRARAMDELNAIVGRPVTLARVITGVPMEPNATGAVFASRQMPAA